MAIETIKKSALTDIANAIGIQNGGTDTYPPSEMAAVLALDDVKEGAPFQAVDTSDAGVISDFVFDAIKAQSRLIKTTHPTRCPPPAILMLSWDIGIKIWTLPLSDETLKLN